MREILRDSLGVRRRDTGDGAASGWILDVMRLPSIRIPGRIFSISHSAYTPRSAPGSLTV
jgi:hypothetical protein